MQKKVAILLLFIIISYKGIAQTTYLETGVDEYNILDRLETLSGRLTNDFMLTLKPISRKGTVSFLSALQDSNATHLSAIDKYNIAHLISKNGEWYKDSTGTINSKKPLFKNFYKKQPDFFYINKDNFFLSLNPVISGQAIYEKDNPRHMLLSNSHGLELRGWIAKRIGFYTYFADNQEETPTYLDTFVKKQQAIPGADYYTRTATTNLYDYFLARGYIDFAIIKNYTTATFGYDKHFIGDGIRSLFLSDFSASSPFLRLNTHIWKMQYQNLFLELTPQNTKNIEGRFPQTYAAVHTLNVNVTNWLNIGLFESVVFSRSNGLEIRYLNPIILYRELERSLNSPDNENLGFSFKAVAAKHIQLYGQFFLDEFKSKEFFSNKGWWGNKWGLQTGCKYYDAFNVKNLDLQAELNMVRPYTYSHDDTFTNYTNYNQALAHPLGSGFIECIVVVKYQPAKNWFITLKEMYYIKGVDTGSKNYGNDIFKSYSTLSTEYGVRMINGLKSTCNLINLNVSYQLRESLFIDLGFTHRQYVFENNYYPQQISTYIYGGIRLNLARRDYSFF
jgi:hypothetical protein